ncbi:twin-arginine translocase TatA/TatE family subunit [Pseudomonas sp. BN417]|uniref:twin-arginine translocase TatA/TatE family subunit n=1 Tax=Pseudomonas sp. BN417 TaxID=2567890 RepID=UPI0024544881|nr:twin-arginine translocase TatA/TatE family subunit [Pseudomonas sp. BN417]MDH4555645.1 twin-arginine translocase TatA/TatE family subunit [Pseudomonas sp. BN417]
MGIFDWKHWLVILLVALLLFGGKRLRTLGSDLGEAIKGFRRTVAEPTDRHSPPEEDRP